MARLRPDLGGDLGGDGADPFLRVFERVVGIVLRGGSWGMWSRSVVGGGGDGSERCGSKERISHGCGSM